VACLRERNDRVTHLLSQGDHFLGRGQPWMISCSEELSTSYVHKGGRYNQDVIVVVVKVEASPHQLAREMVISPF
jgi:hypothetical protein